MPQQAQVGGALAIWRRLGGVLGVIKDIHLSVHSLGGDEEGVLRHVARPVHLALVVDLLGHLQAASCIL